MRHPYIESATAVSDFYDDEPQEFHVVFFVCRMDFQKCECRLEI